MENMSKHILDRIIKIVRASKDDNEAKEKFYQEFKLTEAQSQAILDMRIRRLTGVAERQGSLPFFKSYYFSKLKR